LTARVAIVEATLLKTTYKPTSAEAKQVESTSDQEPKPTLRKKPRPYYPSCRQEPSIPQSIRGGAPDAPLKRRGGRRAHGSPGKVSRLMVLPGLAELLVAQKKRHEEDAADAQLDVLSLASSAEQEQ
ncbi:hypothetical protein PF007_g22681, partial [Phytophthora fragariae]